MKTPDLDGKPPLLRATRIAILVQALGLLIILGSTIPSYLDYRLQPISCQPDQVCIDLRGVSFVLAALFLGPPSLVLLATYWLWRRPRRWPAALALLVDVAVMVAVVIDLIAFAETRSANPNIVVQVLLGLLPAVVSFIYVLSLLRGWDTRKPTFEA